VFDIIARRAAVEPVMSRGPHVCVQWPGLSQAHSTVMPAQWDPRLAFGRFVDLRGVHPRALAVIPNFEGPDVTRLAACTIVAHNYLPLARILAKSFLDHHPTATFYVVVVDRTLETRAMPSEGFQFVPITDIDFGPEGFAHMAAIYDVTEFATSVKPFALLHLLRHHDCVMYIDPDIKVFAPLDPLVESTLAAGWSLTPHCLQPIPRDGTSPTEHEIMQAGIYNLGYIGVTKAARPMLEWWAQRLRRDAIIDPARQLFTDQRWIDLAVPIWSPHIERSPAYNVAYWNIDQRDLHREGDTFMVGDEVLRFFHFSGYDPKTPYWLSKYFPGDPRVLMSEHDVLADLCNSYGAELKASVANGGPVSSYGWAEAFPGATLTGSLRRQLRDELLKAEREGAEWPPTPFAAGGVEAFRAWLTSVPARSSSRLPPYLAAAYEERLDLQESFPGVRHGELGGFAEWVRTSGPLENSLIRLLGDHIDSVAPPMVPVDDIGRSRDGVDLVGYLKAELGVGEAGRLAAAALTAANVPVSTIACRGSINRHGHPFEVAGTARNDVVLLAVNADQTGIVRHEFGPQFFQGRYIIGQWFWELSEFPRQLAYLLVHEVWAATTHMFNAIAASAPSNTRVVHMPLPLVAPLVRSDIDKSDLGLDDRFTFLFAFDLLSVFERKNPLAVVEAFRRAFAPGEGPRLIIKTINGSQRVKDLERLRWACRDRTDITVWDGYLDQEMSGSLTAACDCYVSLHRAEGLGLTMSEAMALGKPVIATGYSGNLDFMTDDTAVLVPWRATAVGSGAAPYDSAATWAEPDVEVAASAMRRLAGDPGEAARLGAAAKADLETRFNPEVTGARMRERLATIRRTHHG
jgi:glycosyltransferase involved in cell wall biosynthesis